MKRFGTSALMICMLGMMSIIPAPQAGARMVEIVLDASGSMAGAVAGGESRIAAARKAITAWLEILPGDTLLAWRSYGHQSPTGKRDCRDTELLVPFAPAAEAKVKILARLPELQPRGYTPITYVLQQAAGDFRGDSSKEHVIILVSDGKETCEGDPCAAAAALARGDARLIIHTVGFGVDAAARRELDCLARAARGKYYAAANAEELSEVLGKAITAASLTPVQPKGLGWLEVRRADLSGHTVTRADTGEKVANVSRVQAVVKVPAGIYNITVGRALWRSVEVRENEKTVLEPGELVVENAPVSFLPVLESETEMEHGRVSNTKNHITLIPGRYQVMFGKLAWPVEIKEGETLRLKPGVVKVAGAGSKGHKIADSHGSIVGSVSNTRDWLPLPPGDYIIEIDGTTYPFALAEGEQRTFQRVQARSGAADGREAHQPGDFRILMRFCQKAALIHLSTAPHK